MSANACTYATAATSLSFAHCLTHMPLYAVLCWHIIAAQQPQINCVIDSVCDRTPGEVQCPQTAGAALPSRQLQQSEYSHSSPSPLGSSQQQNVLHSSLTPEAQQALLQASRSSLGLPGCPHLSPYLSTATMPAPPFGGAQQTMDSQQLPSLWHNSLQANLNSSTQQGMASSQSIPPLQLPAHVQQWLATLAHNAQQASCNSTALDQPASRERHAQASASSPGRAAASAEVQEDSRQMKAELSDVKARFAETQAWSLLDCCHLSCMATATLHVRVWLDQKQANNMNKSHKHSTPSPPPLMVL